MSARFPHLPGESWDAFLDDRREGEAALRLERHLDGCAACRAALVAADPSRLFRDLRGLTAPASTWDGFWEAVEAEIAEAPAPSSSRRTERLAFAAGLAATFLLLAMLGAKVARQPAAPPLRAEGPCPASAAHLHLSREECMALFGGPIEAREPPLVILRTDLDLRGL